MSGASVLQLLFEVGEALAGLGLVLAVHTLQPGNLGAVGLRLLLDLGRLPPAARRLSAA